MLTLELAAASIAAPWWGEGRCAVVFRFRCFVPVALGAPPEPRRAEEGYLLARTRVHDKHADQGY